MESAVSNRRRRASVCKITAIERARLSVIWQRKNPASEWAEQRTASPYTRDVEWETKDPRRILPKASWRKCVRADEDLKHEGIDQPAVVERNCADVAIASLARNSIPRKKTSRRASRRRNRILEIISLWCGDPHLPSFRPVSEDTMTLRVINWQSAGARLRDTAEAPKFRWCCTHLTYDFKCPWKAELRGSTVFRGSSTSTSRS